jgi:hypothetical protein
VLFEERALEGWLRTHQRRTVPTIAPQVVVDIGKSA